MSSSASRSPISASTCATGEALARVDGPLVVSTVETWSKTFAAQLAQSAGLAIDLGEASDFDAFGLQLLVAVRRLATAKGKSFRLSDAGDRFAEACAASGFAPEEFAPVTASFP